MPTDDSPLQKLDAVCITCKREKDQSPFTFQETVQFQRGIILEGIDRGVSLIQILERLVSETPLSGQGASSEAIIAELRLINQAQIDYYKSPSHKYAVCQKCRTFTDADKFVCIKCAGVETSIGCIPQRKVSE